MLVTAINRSFEFGLPLLVLWNSITSCRGSRLVRTAHSQLILQASLRAGYDQFSARFIFLTMAICEQTS
jgi:hypothetical protein